MTRIRVLAGVIAGAAVLVAASSPAAAQLRLSPWVGLYAPTNDLGSVRAIDLGKMASTLAYGADFEFGGTGAFGFRVGAGYATDSEVDFDNQTCIACELRATVLTGTGAIVIRPLPLPAVRPYLVAGAGWKWYDFDFEGDIEDELSDQANFTWQGGIGAVISPAGMVGLVIEVSDFVSDIDFDDGTTGNTQHDLMLKVGVSLSLGG